MHDHLWLWSELDRAKAVHLPGLILSANNGGRRDLDCFELLLGWRGGIGEGVDHAGSFVEACLNDNRRRDLKSRREPIDIDANRAMKIVGALGFDGERLAAAGV